MQANKQTGRVIIAAAGPGDPELITAKAMRFLQQADIVLTDRLVSDVILSEYANENAKIIYVGKQCRRGASTPQQTINELMVQHAQDGKLVVRLKGGDVSIFSNVLDELEVLKANNIAYEIVPGVTSALGAAAYTGIPLTARGYSTAVRFLTYYKSEVINEAYWKELASTNDTLVFYMSADTLEDVVSNLIKHHVSHEVHIAVVEQATTPLQNIYHDNIYDFANVVKQQSYVSPTLVIIGKVAALTQQYGWIENSGSKDYYFKPVASIHPSTHTTNTISHVSRA